jgi:tetratricopeptide (TPR) repeat protein
MARAERLPRFPLGASAEGRGILEDFPSSLGVLLASAIRDLGMRVEQGAPVPGSAAARLAAIRGHLGEQEVVAPLIVIARSVAGELTWDVSEVTRACRQIAEWAAHAGARRTHFEFVRVSARLYPGDLEVVLEAARLSRDLGDSASAELWFRHVIRRGRASEQWKSYVWAYIGMGVLYLRAGNTPAAEVVLHRATRVAHRHRLVSEAGSAHHHLFNITAEAGRLKEAYYHAETALRCYGENHDRLRHLSHDAGRFWIAIGEFARAVPVLAAVLPAFEADPDERTRCRANLAWAAGGAGDVPLFERTVGDTIVAVTRGARTEIAAEAHLHLGYGWELLGRFDAAERMANQARVLSASVGAVKIQEKADELLERVQSMKPLQQAGRRAAEAPKIARRGQLLASELAALWAGVASG